MAAILLSIRAMLDVNKMIKELRAQRDAVDETIIILQRLGATSGRRQRGRPPKWMTAATAIDAPTRRARRRGDDAKTRAVGGE